MNKSTKKRSGHVCCKEAVVSAEIPKTSITGSHRYQQQPLTQYRPHYRPTVKLAQVYQNYRADTTVNHVIGRGLKTDILVVF